MLIISTVFAKSSCIWVFGYSIGMPLIVIQPSCMSAWLVLYLNSRPVGFFFKVIHQCVSLVSSTKHDSISTCGILFKTCYVNLLHIGSFSTIWIISCTTFNCLIGFSFEFILVTSYFQFKGCQS